MLQVRPLLISATTQFGDPLQTSVCRNAYLLKTSTKQLYTTGPYQYFQEARGVAELKRVQKSRQYFDY